LVFLKVSRMPVRFKVVQKPIKSLAYMGFEEDDVMIGNLLILFSLVVALMDVSKILEHLPKL
jgi:hypothetical protein